VQELDAKIPSKDQKQQNCAKTNSPWRSKGEPNGEYFQRAPKTEQQHFAMARKILPGELRRPKYNWWRGRNPLRKKAQLAIVSCNSLKRAATYQKRYKSLSLIFIGLWCYLERQRHYERQRGKQGKLERTSKSKEYKGLKGFTRSLRYRGLLPFHLFFPPCKVTMTMSS